jgi:hypothetical protein
MAGIHACALIPAATSSASAAGRDVHPLPFHVPFTLLSESIDEVITVQSPALTQDSPLKVCSPPLASGAGIGLGVPPFQVTASPWL